MGLTEKLSNWLMSADDFKNALLIFALVKYLLFTDENKYSLRKFEVYLKKLTKDVEELKQNTSNEKNKN